MKVSSWGRFPPAQQTCQPLFWRHQNPFLQVGDGSLLAYGLGRSYGDVCLNDGAHLLLTRDLDRFIDFCPKTGVLTAEAGVSLEEVLTIFVPRGWFPPVTPGTQQVTLGGMLANDVHGKNHHHDGSFGNHVLELGLWRSQEGHLICSPHQNEGLFKATIGGLGLTGLITYVRFQMTAIGSSAMAVETHRFNDLEEFLDLTETSDDAFRYTVAWLDTSHLKRSCRGIFYRGNHAKAECLTAQTEAQKGRPARKPKSWRMPFRAPRHLLNRASISLFNWLYFHRHGKRVVGNRPSYETFFYPLDRIANWNELYGRRGPLQYQCVVPDTTALRALLDLVAQSKQVSFLTVLKKFGSRPSPGYLSFPRPGFTLAMDFAITEDVLALCDRLDACVLAACGAVYPAKDARMSASHFQKFFPGWQEWHRWVDPRLSSSFYRRIIAQNTESASP